VDLTIANNNNSAQANNAVNNNNNVSVVASAPLAFTNPVYHMELQQQMATLNGHHRHLRRHHSCSSSSEENGGGGGGTLERVGGVDASPSPSTPTPPPVRKFSPGLRAPRTNPQCTQRSNWRGTNGQTVSLFQTHLHTCTSTPGNN
jgi:RAS protein activator-like 2